MKKSIITNLPTSVPMSMAIEAVTEIVKNIYTENKQTKVQKGTGELLLSRDELRRALTEVMHVSHDWRTLAIQTLRSKNAPLHLMLEQITAIKAAMGPLAQEEYARQKAYLDHKRKPPHPDWMMIHEVVLKEKEGKLNKVQAKIEKTRELFAKLQLEVSRRVSLDADKHARDYQDVIDNLDPDGTKSRSLSAVAERIVNRGELKVGALVRVKHDNALTKAKVIRVTGRGHAARYDVSCWNEVCEQRLTYETGYDTRDPIIVKHLERSSLYATTKEVQVVLSNPDKVPVNDLRFLTLLLHDAVEANKLLHVIGHAVENEVNSHLKRKDAVHAHHAPLKRTTRINTKVFEKYDGEFDKVTDIARMTFECVDYESAEMTLQCVHARKEIDVVLIKNRLMPEFKATEETGGYRDMLLNCRVKSTKHLVEIQITFRELLKIKTDSGNDEYKLIRTLGLNEEITWSYSGDLTDKLMLAVASGLIREVQCKTPHPKKMYDKLAATLSHRGCLVRKLECEDMPNTMALHDVMTSGVLKQLAARITKISVRGFGVLSTIPDMLFQCTQLTWVDFAQSSIEGSLPKNGFSSLKHLQTLHVWDTRMDMDVSTQLDELKAIALLPNIKKVFCNFHYHIYLDVQKRGERWCGYNREVVRQINDHVLRHSK